MLLTSTAPLSDADLRRLERGLFHEGRPSLFLPVLPEHLRLLATRPFSPALTWLSLGLPSAPTVGARSLHWACPLPTLIQMVRGRRLRSGAANRETVASSPELSIRGGSPRASVACELSKRMEVVGSSPTQPVLRVRCLVPSFRSKSRPAEQSVPGWGKAHVAPLEDPIASVRQTYDCH